MPDVKLLRDIMHVANRAEHARDPRNTSSSVESALKYCVFGFWNTLPACPITSQGPIRRGFARHMDALQIMNENRVSDH